MGFSLEVSVPVFTVFLQGLLSFFSPCVLPLIPLYIGYLSGGTKVVDEEGRAHYKKSKVLGNTLFFVLGVSFAFFILGLGVSAAGTFFKGNQALFARIGAVIIILFGLYQLGIFGRSTVLGKERRFTVKLERLGMSPLTAFIMGFTFSFAWTPCVGPALASVLLMSATAGSQTMGFLLIGVYTLGFVLPFLAVGMFTTSLLELFKKHGNVVKYTIKVTAVLMILMGVLMFTGKMNGITGYLSKFSQGAGQTGSSQSEAGKNSENEGNKTDSSQSEAGKNSENGASQSETGKKPGNETDQSESGKKPENETGQSESGKSQNPPAVDFTLTDQNGDTHILSDYKGKTVFLNFWATWCPPCRAEMPDIQKIYEEYAEAEDDSLVILGIAAPDYGREGTEEDITGFLKESGYTYPVVMDYGGEIFEQYGIYSYPTTVMIDKEGNVFGYASGQLTEDIMRSIIRQTMEGKREAQ